MKKILLITICLLAAAAAVFAQSSTDKVRQFERLMREWKSASYNTGSETYTQLKAMMSEGCKMSERVAKAYIDEFNASTFDIRANAWFQYIKEKRISISLRDLREKTGDDGRRIVYCWIKYIQPGKPDKEDFVGFTFDTGKIFYICNNDVERANRLKTDSEGQVVESKPATSIPEGQVQQPNGASTNNAASTHNPPQHLEGYEPYAVLKDSTLTFYYGKNKPYGAYDVEKEVDSWQHNKEWTDISEKIKTVVFDQSFKNYRPTSCAYWFCNCKNLTKIIGMREYLNTENVTDMSYMFTYCSGLTSLDLSSFNTENVTNMGGMFSWCSGLTSLDVSSFNTANVTNMISMFDWCSGLTNLDVSGFKTDNVTSMWSMFFCCLGLTNLDLRGFNTEKVTDMSSMFHGCRGLKNLDVSSFNTEKVTNMSSMFYDCSGLTSLDVSSFNTENVRDMYSMFNECSGLTSLDVSNFNTENVENMEYMFRRCYNLKTIYVGASWNTKKVKESRDMFDCCENLYGEQGTECVLEKTTVKYAHIDMGASAPGYLTQKGHAPYKPVINYSKIQPYAILMNGVLYFRYDGQRPVNSFSMPKFNASSWHGIAGNFTKVVFDTAFSSYKRSSLNCWFADCDSLIEIVGLENLNTSNVVDMTYMFLDCRNLSSLDLGSFKTDNVTDMHYMFYGCSGLTSLDLSSFNTDNVTDMDHMFMNCSGLSSLDLSSFNTDNVTDMNCMFNGCRGLRRLGISCFKTDNVTDIGGMFAGCSGLTSLELGGFKTDNVTNMIGVFHGCSGLTSLDLGGFKTDNVTFMEDMFRDCSNLKTIYAGADWNTSTCITKKMFENCTNLVGGNGTKYSTYNNYGTFARIDGGSYNPGYFTRK